VNQRRLGRAAALVTLAVVLCGCSQLLNGLRRDFSEDEYDSGPTTGGRFAEGGALTNSYYDRYPSEQGGGDRNAPTANQLGGSASWMDDEQEERARRFSMRTGDDGAPSYANRPTMTPSQKKLYKNGMRATRADFIDDAKDDGSLWTSDGQTNYYLTKNKVRTVGDILTITADETMVGDVAAELKRTLTPEERDEEMEIAQERLKRKALGMPDDPAGGDQVANSASSASRSPATEKATDKEKDVEVPNATWADVDLKKAIEFKAGDAVMAEVVERYPNGNYKIRGVKRVRYRGGYRMVNVTAIAKNADITDEETIPAGKLYEYRLEALR